MSENRQQDQRNELERALEEQLGPLGEDVDQVQSEEEQKPMMFTLDRIYIKSLSFEAPNTPEIFEQQGTPTIDVNMNTEGRILEEEEVPTGESGEGEEEEVESRKRLESVLTVQAEASHGDQMVFKVQVQQAGIFRTTNIPDDQMNPFMEVHCPTVLFPYAREAVSNLVTRGSFQQLLLEPVNFQELYESSFEESSGGSEGNS